MEVENYIYILAILGLVFILLLHQIYGYIRNRKFYIYDKGEIVEARVLTKEEMNTYERGNTLCKIRYIYDGEYYFHTLITTRLELPKDNEKIDITFNIKNRTIGSAYDITMIFVLLFVFIAIICIFLVEMHGRYAN